MSDYNWSPPVLAVPAGVIHAIREMADAVGDAIMVRMIADGGLLHFLFSVYCYSDVPREEMVNILARAAGQVFPGCDDEKTQTDIRHFLATHPDLWPEENA